MGEFAGKTAIVTGASRGIGRAIALDLGGDGARVVVNYARSEPEAARVVEEVRAAGGDAIACQADVARKAEVERMLADALDAFGTVDLLVNNAGINIDRPFLELSEEDWDRVVDTNLKGAFLCSQAAGRVMDAGSGGCIVNISAVTAVTGRKNAANYCASKAGLDMLTKCVALELAPKVRVNSLAVGFIASPIVERLYTKEQLADIVEVTPLRRMGAYEEVAAAVRFFASEAAAFVTGQTLIVDGGRVMR